MDAPQTDLKSPVCLDSLAAPKRLKLLVTIVDRGRGKIATEHLQKFGLVLHMTAHGKGTAKSEILEYLGLGETEKDVVLSLGERDKVRAAIEHLKENMRFKEPGHGIAFTIPIMSVGGKFTLQCITGEEDEIE